MTNCCYYTMINIVILTNSRTYTIQLHAVTHVIRKLLPILKFFVDWNSANLIQTRVMTIVLV